MVLSNMNKFKKIGFYILSIFIKIILLILVTSFISTAFTSGTITNDIAINQLENNDEAYLELQAYNAMMPIAEIIIKVVTVFIGLAIFYDFYKIIMIINDDDDDLRRR